MKGLSEAPGQNGIVRLLSFWLSVLKADGVLVLRLGRRFVCHPTCEQEAGVAGHGGLDA
ncbi:MAG: hypothetical protein AAGI50_04990 [Pseudomonadota bacterium]